MKVLGVFVTSEFIKMCKVNMYLNEFKYTPSALSIVQNENLLWIVK